MTRSTRVTNWLIVCLKDTNQSCRLVITSDTKHHFVRVFKPLYTVWCHYVSACSKKFVSKNVSKSSFSSLHRITDRVLTIN